MRNALILAALAALAFTSIAEAKSCKDAKGHFVKCPTAAAASAMAANEPATAPKAAAAARGAPHCTKGKPCGKSCIAVDKVCHK
jgi:hypothetical protein